MSGFPGSPRLNKGGLVSLTNAIVFQYNPEQLTRTITPNTFTGGGGQNEPLRFKGPPSESISLEVQISAADQLERARSPATTMGIYPMLSALELLVYPLAARMAANQALALLGVIEVVPPEAPLTLFVWGPRRVLPVRITQMSITEESFDPALNPIQAKVGLTLQVLTYQDLGLLHAGGAMFMGHHLLKEVMAGINLGANHD